MKKSYKNKWVALCCAEIRYMPEIRKAMLVYLLSVFRFFIQLSSGLQWCVWREEVTHDVSCTDLSVINYIALSEHTVTNDDDLAVFAGTRFLLTTFSLIQTHKYFHKSKHSKTVIIFLF